MLWELIRKDLKIFFSDRRAMVISFAVPVAIASFMAVIFGHMGSSTPTTKIRLLVADEDSSPISLALMKKLSESTYVLPEKADKAGAQAAIRNGDAPVALVVPKGFGAEASSAFGGGKKPTLKFLVDPSKNVEAQAVRGVVIEDAMQTVAKTAFGGGSVDPSLPFEIADESAASPGATPATQADEQAKATAAHVFGGMAVQGLLFWAVESAMGMMRERRLGLWKRLRAAPVSPGLLLLAKVLSGSIRALLTLALVFAFGALVFRFRFDGSPLGFAMIAVAVALMSGAFGLFVAALGRNEQQSRGLSILAVLVMLMLGGAWFPSFLMPEWVQKIAMAVPVRWAVEGFDAMTWRGSALSYAVMPTLVLLGFAAVFGVIALKRFRWEPEV